MDRKYLTVEAGWIALRKLSDELSATHAKPFTEYFFEEYRDLIHRVQHKAAEASKEHQVSKPDHD